MDTRILRRIQLLLSVPATLAVALAIGGAAAVAGPAGPCLTVDVNAAVLLPDGSVRQAATLSLCLNRDFTPVAGLHEISLDGNPVGLLLSRRVPSETDATAAPFVLFERDGEGRLRLIGYASQRGAQWRTYLLAQPRPPRRGPGPRPAPVGEAVVQLAAHARR